MNIIERNFFRLLRVGAFNQEEPIEPLSAWKWRRLYQLSLMHDVESLIRRGISRCEGQFFVQIPENLLAEWRTTDAEETEDENVMLTPDHLTNPILNKRLQSILDEEDTTMETRQMLQMLLGIARFIMNAGIPVKRIAELAIFLRHQSGKIDFERIGVWTERLKLQPMAQLAGVLLIRLMHMEREELPFMTPESDAATEKQLHKILKLKNSHAEEWYFSQGKNIFVHTSNPSAMLWHVRRSAQYFRYYPSETLTNFVTSFAHSLSHIEE